MIKRQSILVAGMTLGLLFSISLPAKGTHFGFEEYKDVPIKILIKKGATEEPLIIQVDQNTEERRPEWVSFTERIVEPGEEECTIGIPERFTAEYISYRIKVNKQDVSAGTVPEIAEPECIVFINPNGIDFEDGDVESISLPSPRSTEREISIVINAKHLRFGGVAPQSMRRDEFLREVTKLIGALDTLDERLSASCKSRESTDDYYDRQTDRPFNDTGTLRQEWREALEKCDEEIRELGTQSSRTKSELTRLVRKWRIK